MPADATDTTISPVRRTSSPAPRSPTGSTRCSTRAAALKADRPALGADSLAGRSVAADLRAAVDADAGLLRGRRRRARRHADRLAQRRAADQPGGVDRRHRPGHVAVSSTRSRSARSPTSGWSSSPSAADVPVINALTPLHHPCQAIADLQTLRERFGSLEGLRVAFVGDGNNVARSLALLGSAAGVEVVVSSPPGFELDRCRRRGAGRRSRARRSPAPTRSTPTSGSAWAREAADLKRAALVPYRVDDELLVAGGGSRRRPALPARPSRRGDQRRGSLRAALSGLRPGREPPPRPEGAAGDAARLRTYPARLESPQTPRPRRLMVSTPDFQSGNGGSIPPGATTHVSRDRHRAHHPADVRAHVRARLRRRRDWSSPGASGSSASRPTGPTRWRSPRWSAGWSARASTS